MIRVLAATLILLSVSAFVLSQKSNKHVNTSAQAQEDMNQKLLDTLINIAIENPFPNSELIPMDLWNNHPEVAVMQCEITSIDEHKFSEKSDTIKTISTLIFQKLNGKWNFAESWGFYLE